MADTTRAPLITDEDVEAAIGAYDDAIVEMRETGIVVGAERRALEEVAPRLRARWVAEALEEVADDQNHLCTAEQYYRLRALAAEYREGNA